MFAIAKASGDTLDAKAPALNNAKRNRMKGLRVAIVLQHPPHRQRTSACYKTSIQPALREKQFRFMVLTNFLQNFIDLVLV
jgi:hypothetical protein